MTRAAFRCLCCAKPAAICHLRKNRPSAAGFFMSGLPRWAGLPWPGRFHLTPPGQFVCLVMPRKRRPWLSEAEDDLGDSPFDSRPPWEKLNPAAGVPAWEALFHFVDQRRAADLFELDLCGYGDLSNVDPAWWPDERREFEIHNGRHYLGLLDLRAELWGKLLRGELIAYGFSNQAPLDAPRRPIAAERWHDLVIDVRNSTASGPGIEITQIRIHRPGAAVSLEASGKRYSPVALRQWYIDRIRTCDQAGRMPSREDDYQEANARFDGTVPKRAVESLRRELAPEKWTRKGRRTTS